MSKSAAIPAHVPASNVESLEDAHKAGLRYVDDRTPGIRRQKRGRSFAYVDQHGRSVRDARTLERVRKLAIPPAWNDVWICASPEGHIQATGRDARGRKQYRYHARFREVRDANKYERIFDFAANLPRIRAHCQGELDKPGLSKDKVLAAVIALLEQTLIRVGNEEYSRLNQSFGLTTLRDRHALIHGGSVEFRFRGKSGKHHDVSITDRRLAHIVKRCQDLPGDELFQYLDEHGDHHAVGSSDVNDYLRAITGEEITAKDFRTWAGTVLAALALADRGKPPSKAAAKRHINDALKHTAERLGNTPAVCRKCYVHPAVLDAYLRGRVVPSLRAQGPNDGKPKLRADERAVLAFLRSSVSELAREQRPGGLERALSRSVRRAQRARERRVAAARPKPVERRRRSRPHRA